MNGTALIHTVYASDIPSNSACGFSRPQLLKYMKRAKALVLLTICHQLHLEKNKREIALLQFWIK